MIVSAFLAGCGLRGPLYLPKEDTASTPETTQETAKEDADKPSKKEKKDSQPH